MRYSVFYFNKNNREVFTRDNRKSISQVDKTHLFLFIAHMFAIFRLSKHVRLLHIFLFFIDINHLHCEFILNVSLFAIAMMTRNFASISKRKFCSLYSYIYFFLFFLMVVSKNRSRVKRQKIFSNFQENYNFITLLNLEQRVKNELTYVHAKN